MDQLHLFISLLLRGSIMSKFSLKMSGKVREFDLDWRLATLPVVKFLKCVVTEVILFSVVAFKTLAFHKVV